MKMKKLNKGLLGLFLIAFSILAVYFAVSPVAYAKDDEKTEEDKEKEKADQIKCQQNYEFDFANKYGIKMKYEEPGPGAADGMFIVYMNLPDELKSQKNKVKFKVKEIFVTDISRTATTASGKQVEYDITYKEIKLKDNPNHVHIYRDITSETQLVRYFGLTGNGELTDGGAIKFTSKAAGNDGIRQIKLNTVGGEDTSLKYFVVLEPVGFEDEVLKDKCGAGSAFIAHTQFLYYGDPSYTRDTPTVSPRTPAPANFIECGEGTAYVGKYPNKNSFEYLYCDSVYKALQSGAQWVQYDNANPNYSKKFGSNSAESYYCNAFDVTSTRKITDDNYYTNTNYLLGTIEYTVDAGTYTYNYGGQEPYECTDSEGNKKTCYKAGTIIDTENAQCKVRCDEVVTVEYGPPIASKAGLCFEYKVQVTSRVNCKTIEYPKLPRDNMNVCTPSPGCNHGSGFIDLGAGPSEEFDACIAQCDGGKYTSKCSKKCYKEVYGTNSKTAQNASDDVYFNTTLLALRYYDHNTVDRDFTKDGVGYYLNTNPDKNGKGWMIWREAYHLGRWYVENHQNGAHACLKTEKEGGGILSLCGCWAECRWNGCQGNKYLNPGEAARDYENNIKKYNDMVAKCDAYSKCSTTKSTFSIETDYSYGENSTTTIYFPYTNTNDGKNPTTIQYNNENGASSVTCVPPKNKPESVVYHSEGCYECGKTEVDATKFYQTEWGFPGTWIHNKTGEISYIPKNDWIPYIKSFCLPLDAKEVNSKWWLYYYHERYKDNPNYSFNDPKFGTELCPGQDFNNATFTQSDVNLMKNSNTANGDKQGYNIRANTKKFGQFGWNININCFYALNADCLPPTTQCNDPPCENAEDMRVRSIDLNNVFPSEDGSKLPAENTTGRTPGYNWSKYAINLQSGKYVIEPEDYLYNGVQERGYSIYSDEQLDYEVFLSKDSISKLRSRDRVYTQFEGTVDENGTVTVYKSPLFRGNGAILGNAKKPDGQALGCNNIINRSQCEYFGGGAN